jgi:hypothetical protein
LFIQRFLLRYHQQVPLSFIKDVKGAVIVVDIKARHAQASGICREEFHILYFMNGLRILILEFDSHFIFSFQVVGLLSAPVVYLYLAATGECWK